MSEDTGGLNPQQKRLLEGLYQFYREGQLTDVTLDVEGQQFACNRNILAASSPFFKAMFTSDVKESTDNVVPIHGISKDAMESLLDYMYSGRLNLTNENVQNVFSASNFLEMLEVVDMCIEHISGALTLSNCLDVFFFAVYNYCEKLKLKSGNFILKKFPELAETEEFLSKIEVTDLIWFLSSDDIYVDREEYIFEYILKWIEFDPESRRRHFPKLFKCLRLPLINDEYFEEKVASHSLVQENSFCRGLLTSFSLFKIQQAHLLEVDEDSPFANPVPRLGMYNRKLIIYSGGAYTAEERSFTAFDPVTKKNYYGIKPHPSFDFKFRIDYFSLVTTDNNNIYFIGGIFYENYHFSDTGQAVKDFLLYDEKESKWLAQKPMGVARCQFAACNYGDEVYVCGGKSFHPVGEPTDSVEVFDPEINFWTVMEPMPMALYQHSICCHNKALFVFGGKDVVDEHVDNVFRFDIPTNSWCVVRTNMLKPRSEHMSLPVSGKIYIVGGGSRHSNAVEVEIYDPATNRWTYGTDFVEERKILAGCVFDGQIYTTGGVRQFSRPQKPTRTVETKDFYRYDVHTNQWQKLVRFIQYANTQCCTVATLNIKFLHESDFISVGEGIELNEH
ncbi:kelch-like protein 40a [Saccostrea cucullata]|uniref:kelch-like protein 40a n=1 Tax=Saccostrea cuccullata TaxID=36930 RepID=UPI002ED4BD84